MPADRPPKTPNSKFTSSETCLSRRHFIGAAVAVLNASGPASADVGSSTETTTYVPMVGAAAYDFNLDSDPRTPGYDWNDL